jgi:heme iron utilization protein
MIDSTIVQEVLALLRRRRWAALAALEEDGAPAASMAAYALDEENGELILHLSGLAAHTRMILARPRIALAVGDPDCAEGRPDNDPQLLARVSLSGPIHPIDRADPGYPAAKALYLARLPTAERLFALGDFRLFRFRPESLRYVGGFGRAASLGRSQLFP